MSLFLKLNLTLQNKTSELLNKPRRFKSLNKRSTPNNCPDNFRNEIAYL